MFGRWSVVFIFTVLLVPIVKSQASDCWASPWIEDSNADGIQFINEGSVDINEELDVETLVVKIKYLKDDGGPTFTSNMDHKTLYNTSIEKRNDEWFLIIQQSPNFEDPTVQKSGYFTVDSSACPDQKILSVTLINVDDSKPTLRLSDSSGNCEIAEDKELGSPLCSFQVHDDDGCAGSATFTTNDDTFDFIIDSTCDSSGAPPDCLHANTLVKDCNVNIQLKKQLDYETKSTYLLTVDVKDPADNTNTISTIIVVTDVADQAPKWSSIPTIINVNEKEEKEVPISAFDGDIGIQNDINFTLTYEDDLEPEQESYFSLEPVDSNSAKLMIRNIDRDKYRKDSYKVYVEAYEVLEPDSKTEISEITIIVADINDQSPQFYLEGVTDLDAPVEISLYEQTVVTLSQTLTVEDADSGTSGTIKLSLQDKSNKGKENAFIVVPNQIYQNGSISLSVKDPNLLDYEDEDWREPFTIQLVAEEQDDPSHIATIDFNITLINTNDNSPEFYNITDGYIQATVQEDINIGDPIITIQAYDKDNPNADDIVDTIRYFASSTDQVTIDPDTGEVTVANNFDFETRQFVLVQVYATDSLSTGSDRVHTTYATLKISVTDINDTPPTLQINPGTVNINETFAGELSVDITVKDLDTENVLDATIDWDKSRATKQAVAVDISKIKDAFELTPNPIDMNSLEATLVMTEELNWSDVDTVYLAISATDGKTTAEGQLNIQIADVNNNAPEFTAGSCSKSRSVVENSIVGTLIGTVTAVDKDDPKDTVLSYSMVAMPGTASDGHNYVTIDPDTGVLTVASSDIDRECEGCETLDYEVTVSDSTLNANCTVSIDIVDDNDNDPEVIINEGPDSISEQAVEGFIFRNITARDNDTDPYNNLTFTIDYKSNLEIQKYFSIDYLVNEAWLMVSYADSYKEIDCDGDRPKQYTINVIIQDNAGVNSGSRKINVPITINIKDENDNDPIIQNAPSDVNECFISASEATKAGEILSIPIKPIATDADSGLNGDTKFTNLVIVERIIYIPELCDEDADLLEIQEDGFIKAKRDLGGCPGNYVVEIEVQDKGDPPRHSTANFTICIFDINDQTPQFVFPTEEEVTIKLANDNSSLIFSDGSPIPALNATDLDYDKNARITFIVSSEPEDYFEVEETGDQTASLKFKDGVTFDDLRVNFNITITATDSADIPIDRKYNSTTVLVHKIDTRPAQPQFSDPTATFQFTENSTGLQEHYEIPEANDPNNVNVPVNATDYEDVYYRIEGNDEEIKHFQLDDRILTLNKDAEYLDATVKDNYTFQIIAYNEPPAPIPEENSILVVTVTVKDINDKPPHFTNRSYPAGASAAQNQQIILTVDAVDPDTNAIIKYSNVNDSETASDSLLLNDFKNKFKLIEDTGQIQLNFEPQPDSQGWISWKIQAQDEASNPVGHSDVCDVIVYLITPRQQRTFVFQNSTTEIESYKNQIVSAFSSTFDSDCVVDSIMKATDAQGQVMDNKTDVTVHFMEEDSVVDGEQIDKITEDSQKMNLLIATLTINSGLNLVEIGDSGSGSGSGGTGSTTNLQWIFVGLTAILGVILILTIVLFTWKNRMLSNRLVHLATNKYDGSPASNTETDKGFVLPNTNQHAQEGANPVWNTEVNENSYDNISQSSSTGSELIGIEDNPEFENPPDLDNPDFVNFYNDIVEKENNENSGNDYVVSY